MANFTTVNDLKEHALWRASEPTDGSSDYDAVALTYLNAMQLGLLLGGPFGPEDEKGITLPVVDWWWALKQPAGVFNLEAEVSAGTVSIDQGSSTLTFSSAPATTKVGWRVRVNALPTVPRIQLHSGGAVNATLDAPWPEADQTGVSYKLFKLEYTLASDFLRFAGRPALPVWPYRMDVVSLDALETSYPLATISAASAPAHAAMIGPALIRVAQWTEKPLRIEYPYIAAPADLTAGGVDPVLPRHHRRLLATGAAALILFDKGNEKAAALLREVLAGVRGMQQEHYHQMRRMSTAFGRIEPRQGQLTHGAGPLRTASGLIIGP